jgi:hypothetical protein
VRKPSAKLAARRAKVLSYEAQLAPGQGPKPVKGVQKGAVPTKSEGELKRVEQLAAHLRTLQEDEEARERLRRQEEEAALRLALTSVSHRRGADKTAFDVWDAHPESTTPHTTRKTRHTRHAPQMLTSSCVVSCRVVSCRVVSCRANRDGEADAARAQAGGGGVGRPHHPQARQGETRLLHSTS